MNLLGLILISLALGVLAWLGFLWSVRSGQYEDPEGPKYRMLDDDDEGPPPTRPAPDRETQAITPPGASGGDDRPRTPGPTAPGSQPPDRS